LLIPDLLVWEGSREMGEMREMRRIRRMREK
jgi:hypothetical protein